MLETAVHNNTSTPPPAALLTAKLDIEDREADIASLTARVLALEEDRNTLETEFPRLRGMLPCYAPPRHFSFLIVVAETLQEWFTIFLVGIIYYF